MFMPVCLACSPFVLCSFVLRPMSVTINKSPTKLHFFSFFYNFVKIYFLYSNKKFTFAH